MIGMWTLHCQSFHDPNIPIIGVPEEEDKRKSHEKILEEKIVENFIKGRRK